MVPVAVAPTRNQTAKAGGVRREARIKLRKKIDSYEASPMKKAENRRQAR